MHSSSTLAHKFSSNPLLHDRHHCAFNSCNPGPFPTDKGYLRMAQDRYSFTLQDLDTMIHERCPDLLLYSVAYADENEVEKSISSTEDLQSAFAKPLDPFLLRIKPHHRPIVSGLHLSEHLLDNSAYNRGKLCIRA